MQETEYGDRLIIGRVGVSLERRMEEAMNAVWEKIKGQRKTRDRQMFLPSDSGNVQE